MQQLVREASKLKVKEVRPMDGCCCIVSLMARAALLASGGSRIAGAVCAPDCCLR